MTKLLKQVFEEVSKLDGAERLEELRKETIALALRERHLPERDLQRVNVGIRVQLVLGHDQRRQGFRRCFGNGTGHRGPLSL